LEQYVTHTREDPWFGTGQGSGNSPMYWLMISSTMNDLYAQKATRSAVYHTPDWTTTIQIHQLGFVDDVNNRTNLPWTDASHTNERLDQLIQQASHDGQLWHNLMESVNQLLELSKCKYHVIRYEFKPSGRVEIVTECPPPTELRICDKSNSIINIQYVSNTAAVKYLGCWKAPKGQVQEKQSLKEKCDTFARVINCSHLSRKETKCFYKGIYKPSVGYPLPITYFTFSELDTIQQKAHTAMVTHCGFNRNTAKAVLYGLQCWGGAAFSHLYDIQGFGQLSYLIKSWRSPNTHQGKMIRITLQWAQFCAGASSPILESVDSPLPHLETEWITSLRKYLSEIKGRIQIKHAGVPPKQREHDEYIMDIAINMKKLKPGQLRRINYCRLYLNVTTLSKITNATGNSIDPAALKGDRDQLSAQSNWQRVLQQRPDKTSCAGRNSDNRPNSKTLTYSETLTTV
jgi:hypothetical protein